LFCGIFLLSGRRGQPELGTQSWRSEGGLDFEKVKRMALDFFPWALVRSVRTQK
jgi:hypothetical protein